MLEEVVGQSMGVESLYLVMLCSSQAPRAIKVPVHCIPAKKMNVIFQIHQHWCVDAYHEQLVAAILDFANTSHYNLLL